MMADTPQDEVRLLREYVSSGTVMQIATSSSLSEPWMAHCWYAADSKLRFVFMSRISRLHSQHILTNPHVSGGILAIELEGLGQTVRGVVFAGSAELLSAADLPEAYDVYRRRWPQVEKLASLEALSEETSENRLWRVSPTRFVLFDEENFPADPRRELTSW